MQSKERMMIALRRGVPDRVPATVHQWQTYHLEKYLGGIEPLEAFRRFGLDAAITHFPVTYPPSPDWQVDIVRGISPQGHPVEHRTITTPGGTLTQTVEYHPTTHWNTTYLVKRPEDVELIDRYMPVPVLDRAAVAREYDRVGDAGILRGFVWGDQGGCWQHAVNLYGLENLIMATYDDPAWVHRFLGALERKKLRFIEESLTGAKYDLIETGGGAASSTCISPAIFEAFCLPYDRRMHDALHAVGLPAVYHTCGGMMPILDLIVANHCDASETLTPPAMGGDARPTEIKRRIGHRVALIGGLNQQDVLDRGTPESIRQEVFRLFAGYGAGGGYIMSPSDHFFETPPENLALYARAAAECRY